MIIKELENNEINIANDLAFKVFLKFEAPEYTKEGIDEFKTTINSPKFISKHTYYGAFENDCLVGMIAARNNKGHIAMFFVEEKMQGKGIGRKLFNEVCKNNENDIITANSSPYAVPIYLHFGFEKKEEEQCVNGIRFTPVKYILKK